MFRRVVTLPSRCPAAGAQRLLRSGTWAQTAPITGKRAAAAAAAAASAALVAAGFGFGGPVEAFWSKPAEDGAGQVLVMAGDCGGTNTRLQLFRVPANAKVVLGQKPPGEIVHQHKYLNETNESFEAVCIKFLTEAKSKTNGLPIKTCCLACAGGIMDNKVTFTNVTKGWTIDGDALQSSLGIPKIKLINDFVAQGYGLLTLADGEKKKLNDATPVAGAPIACVGAGTGLGECFLTAAADGSYTCWPSEGGHAEFSPRNDLAMSLLHYLKGKFDHKKRVSVERVISGTGIANIYEFLRQHWAFESRVNKTIDDEYNAAPASKRGGVVAAGHASGDPTCKEAIDIFIECYGSEVGVAALKWIPTGGLYISGGIAAKNPSWVESDLFLNAYADKGRLSAVVKTVPLYLVLVEDTGERGALFTAVDMLHEA